MTSSKTRVWNWKQADGSYLKVVSNLGKGTISVFDKTGKCVLEKKNLTPEQVKLIEQHFLTVVTQNPVNPAPKNPSSFDPMVA